MLALSGVQLMILGLIGEYLGRLFLTVNRKPQAVVRDVERSEGRTAESAREVLLVAPLTVSRPLP